MFKFTMVHKYLGRREMTFPTWGELCSLLTDRQYMRHVLDYEVVEVGKIAHTTTHDRFNAMFT